MQPGPEPARTGLVTSLGLTSALPLASCVTGGQSLTLSEPELSHVEMGTVAPGSWGGAAHAEACP